MKKIIAIGMFVLMSAYLQAQPKIEISNNATYDWGRVKSSEQVLHTTMILKNIGNEPLKIYSVSPSCGCTTSPLTKTEIAPGDTAQLPITFNISSYTGKVNKTISVHSNDPLNRNIDISLNAFVVRPLTLFPNFLNFANLIVGEQSIAKMVLNNTSDQSIKIKSVEVTPKDLKVNIKAGDEIKPGENFALEADYTPKAGEEGTRLLCKIVLRTTNPDVPEITISGFGNIVEKLEKN
ncbi:MAG TPA: DUF1573 domain-containing protein [Bacteroidota bacterium]|nr:DUF1573 domain-containing protein [Bacteroidota bacterium]